VTRTAVEQLADHPNVVDYMGLMRESKSYHESCDKMASTIKEVREYCRKMRNPHIIRLRELGV